MNKKLEEAIKRLNEDLSKANNNMFFTTSTIVAEIILQALDNSISTEVIEEEKTRIEKEYELLLEHQSGQESNRTKYLRGKIHMCQELLEQK